MADIEVVEEVAAIGATEEIAVTALVAVASLGTIEVSVAQVALAAIVIALTPRSVESTEPTAEKGPLRRIVFSWESPFSFFVSSPRGRLFTGYFSYNSRPIFFLASATQSCNELYI